MGGRRQLAVIGNLGRPPRAVQRQPRLSPCREYPRRGRRGRARGCLRRSAPGSALRGSAQAPAIPEAPPSDEKSSRVFRHCSILTLSKVWFCSALTSSGSNGAQRPVVPKVPLRVARPARPAIWANSAGCQAAKLIAVVFPVGCEGDMIDIEIEPHADSVGGDEVIDVTGLGTSPPGHYGCAVTANPAPRQRHRADAGSIRRSRKPHRRRTRRWRCAAAAA